MRAEKRVKTLRSIFIDPVEEGSSGGGFLPSQSRDAISN